MTNSELGERLKRFREQRKMNRNELANAAGVSPTYIYQLEKGEKSPTIEYLGYICEAMDISLYEFFVDPKQENSTDDKLSKLSKNQRDLFNAFLNSLA